MSLGTGGSAIPGCPGSAALTPGGTGEPGVVSPQKKAAPAGAFHPRCFLSHRRAPVGRGFLEGCGCAGAAGSPPVSPRMCARVPSPAAPAAAPAVWRRLGPALPDGSREVTVLIKVRLFRATSQFLALLLLPEQPEGPPSPRSPLAAGMAQKPQPSLEPNLSILLNCAAQPGTAVLAACLGVRPHKPLSLSALAAAASPGCPREDPGLCRDRRGPRGSGAAVPHPRHRVHGAGAARSPRPPRHRPQLQRGFQPCQHPPQPRGCPGR